MNVSVTGFRFDADAVLSPLSTNAPAGEPLRYEGTYDLISGLRREDDPSLEQGVWKTELKKADWPRVAETCLSAIETKSKDIQIAAWLVEAWIHLHGFAGLREGLHLIAELCDTYWDGLHPDVVDGDLDYRLAPIVWINEKLSITARLIPITNPDSEELSAYSLADWELAGRRPARPRETAPPDVVTDVRFQKSASATPTSWLASVAIDARGALRTLDETVDILKSRCGPRAPALPKMRDAIASALHVVSTTLESRGAHTLASAHDRDDLDEVDRGEVAVALSSDLHDSRDAGPAIRTRAEAYRRLAEAADFLARTEPHSPVPHLIRRAISWGGLSLEELLPELVRDSAQLAEIYRMLQLGEKL
jgi:type VI secretion system protein ImpA